MATQVIDTLITWLKFDADTKGIKQADKGMMSLEKQTKRTSESMETFRRAIEFVGIALSVDKITELNNEYDLTINKLKSLGLAGKQLETVQKQILDISNRTGTSLEANAELYQQLSVSLGETATEAQKLTVMDTLNKLFAINGTETSQSKRAIQDMSKALEGSTVRYQELKQALQDVPALQAVISKSFKAMGTTWQDAIQGNNFSTKKFIDILTQANSQVTKQFNLTSRTIPQAMTAVSNSFAVFFGKIGQSSGAVKGFTGLLDSLADKILVMADWVSDHAQAVKEIAEAIGIFLTMLATRFAIMAAAAIAPFLPLIAGISAVLLLLQDFYTFLSGGDSVFGDFLKKLGFSQKEISNLRQEIIEFFENLKSYIPQVTTLVKGLAIALGVLGSAWAIKKVLGFAGALGKVAISLGKVAGSILGVKKAKDLMSAGETVAETGATTAGETVATTAGEAGTLGFMATASTALKILAGRALGLFSLIVPERLAKSDRNLAGRPNIESGMDLSGFKMSSSTNNSTQHTHNNNFNITVNAMPNSNPEKMAEQIISESTRQMQKQFRNGVLNADSKVYR